MMKVKLFIFISIAALLASCGGYEKILKSSDYVMKYDKAMEYYNNGEYVRAATILEQVATVYRGTTKADTVQYYKAMSYFKQNDYIMAAHYFEELVSTFPNSGFTEESYFLKGYNEYKMSPRPNLDQEYSYKALNTLTLFLINYPGSQKADDARKLIIELKEKLVEKSYLNARLYFDLDNYKAAIIALRNSLTEFPDTYHREELLFMILKANYLLSENSVEAKKPERYQDTVDEYYSFIGEYPEGSYSEEAKRIYSNSMKILGQELIN